MKNTQSLQLRRSSDDAVLAKSVLSAQTFSARLRGLMARAELPAESACLLDPCRSIHTCFMRFNIDVLFLDANHWVIGVSCDVRPWRLRLAPRGTRKVIEMRAGSVNRMRIRTQDQLLLVNND